MNITKLVPVDIQKVWPTEPYHFTPWLLENSELLSEVLGLQVQLTDREHSVGAFSLDLIGHVVGNEDQKVIVENQYGPTDHRHLGQILTYAGGTEPTVIIWIAEAFREEHRAAIDWLNLNTPTDVRFFGIALGAVGMLGAADTLVAPRFDLVCKPNDWEKLARQDAAAGSDGVTPKNALYKQFWTQFEAEAKARKWTTGTPPAANWWTLSSTAPGWQWSVSYMQGGCRSELYIDTGDKRRNKFLLAELEKRQPALSSGFADGELKLQYLPDKRASRVECQWNGPVVTDQGQWPQVVAWLVDTQQRLRDAIAATGGFPVGEPPADWLPPYETAGEVD